MRPPDRTRTHPIPTLTRPTTAPDRTGPGRTAPIPPTPTAPTRRLSSTCPARANVWWPADGVASDLVAETLTAGAIAAADAAGVPVAASEPPLTLVAASSATEPVTRAGGDTGGARVLLYDDTVAAAFRAAADASDTDRGGALAVLTARISLLANSASGPLLVTSDRLGEVTEFGLDAAVDAVTAIPGVTATSLTALSIAEPAPVSLEGSADASRVETVLALRDDEVQIASFATVLEDPTLLTGRERTTALQLIGAGWSGQPAEWRVALDDHAETVTTTLSSVSVRPIGTIQLLSADAPLGIYVQNDLPWPAHLILTAIPDDLRLDVERITPLVAEPGVNTRVQIPVQARVGSGEVTLEVRLLSTTFEPIGSAQFGEVIVRADWEGIGLAALIALVVALVLVGVIRTILRRRRAKRASTKHLSAENPATGLPRTDQATDG